MINTHDHNNHDSLFPASFINSDNFLYKIKNRV